MFRSFQSPWLVVRASTNTRYAFGGLSRLYKEPLMDTSLASHAISAALGALTACAVYWIELRRIRRSFSREISRLKGFAFTPESLKPISKTDSWGGPVPLVSGEVEWLYTPTPRGVKIFILSEGGQALVRALSQEEPDRPWHPLFKRNKAIEEQTGYAWAGTTR